MRLQKKIIPALLISGSLLVVSDQASAHWSSGPFLYNDAGTNPMNLSNKDLASGVVNFGAGINALGTFGTNTGTGTSYGNYTQIRSVASDYGWIQGQDNTLWANSHDNKGLAFTLANASLVSFTVTTLGTATTAVQTQGTGGAAFTTLTGHDWNPAFSIFQGLATQASHEGGVGNTTLKNNLPGYISWSPYASESHYTGGTDITYEATTGNTYNGSGTWGAYRSNADWTAGRDISPSATFGNGSLIGTDQTLGGQNVRVLHYLDSASSTQNSHTVTWSGELGPGDYSIWVGGTNTANALQESLNYQALANHIAGGGTATDAVGIPLSLAIANLRGNYGFTIQTSVAAVPLPCAAWLTLSGLAGLLGMQKRKKMLTA